MSSPPLTPDVDKTPVAIDQPAATLVTTEPGGVAPVAAAVASAAVAGGSTTSGSVAGGSVAGGSVAGGSVAGAAVASTTSPRPASDLARAEWPLWEIFVRSKAGLDHKHCGSLHAADPKMAIQMARDVYTRRQEGVSIWAVRSDQIVASDPGDKAMYFDPMEDKVYRHPTFYTLPDAVDHM